MKYRVLLQKPAVTQSERLPRNPFLIADIWNLPAIRMIVREFEFEARNEKHVRKLLQEARDLGIETVRGFSVRSIEPLVPETLAEQPK